MILKERIESAYMQVDEFILKNNIKPLVTEDLIEEHRKTPIGKHSPNLMKVLNYLRRHHEQIEGKYLIVCTEPHKKWCLGQHPGGRGVRYKIFEEECFPTRAEAEHGLFLKRLKSHGLI